MPYEVKAITKTIKATSRASVKVGESYYTVEYSEERVIPEIVDLEDVSTLDGKKTTISLQPKVDIKKERQDLWDTVNAECDNQIEDILKTFKK